MIVWEGWWSAMLGLLLENGDFGGWVDGFSCVSWDVLIVCGLWYLRSISDFRCMAQNDWCGHEVHLPCVMSYEISCLFEHGGRKESAFNVHNGDVSSNHSIVSVV